MSDAVPQDPPVPGPARVRVPDSRPAPDPTRTGCLWLGGLLGVLAGVVFVFFGVPPLLNFLFPGETVAVGETYEDDKLKVRVDGIEVGIYPVFPESRGYIVYLEIAANSSWNLDEVDFVLQLESGREVGSLPPLIEGSQADRVPQGHSRLQILFVTDRFPYARDLEPAESLHVSEPAVRFELPEPSR